MSTAIFVDAGFYLKRFPAVYPQKDSGNPQAVARILHQAAIEHLSWKGNADRRELYRVFVYDCPPLTKKAHRPISGRSIDFGRTDSARFRQEFHRELKCLRKVALRLGRLQDRQRWRIQPWAMNSLLAAKRTFDDLTDDDFAYEVHQKGTDMRIGLDIASVSYKRQVDQIVLVAGDADFVPAAKLARREGVDFILDPMWARVPEDLHEHIDGLRSTSPRPSRGRSESDRLPAFAAVQ